MVLDYLIFWQQNIQNVPYNAILAPPVINFDRHKAPTNFSILLDGINPLDIFVKDNFDFKYTNLDLNGSLKQ